MTATYHRFEKFKVLLHTDRIQTILAGDFPSPVEWVIYPSNACSYSCGHCIMAEEQVTHKKMLSETAMRKIAHDASRLNIKTVIFSGGGDPLLNPWTLNAARDLKRRGVSVGLNNQGYFLVDPTPFDFIRFSIDAASRETYQQIHQVDGWDQVMANIGRVQYERERGARIELGLAFLITPTNWHEAEEFCRLAQKFTPDFVHLRPAFLDLPFLDAHYPGGDQQLREEILPQLLAKKAAIEAAYPNTYFRVDKFDGYWTPKQYTQCRSTPLLAVTGADGSFLICQDIFDNRWGNYNTQSFEEIWWSEAHHEAISRIRLEHCPRCVENSMNEIIEHCIIGDALKGNLL